jgi:cytoskeletal protein RodZ
MLAAGTGAVDIGTQLRNSREAKRLTLDALSKTTRVQSRVLAAIEQNDASALPPRPFGRGFVRAYAREVGLDPDQTVRDYFNQFAPAVDVNEPADSVRAPETSTHVPMRRTTIAALAVLAAIVAGGVYLATHSFRAPRDTAVVGTSGTAAPTAAAPAISPASTPAVAPPAAAPAAAATDRALDVVIVASEPSWVAASADGQRVVYKVMNAGERATIRATKHLSIRSGNAGGITWTINGRDQGPFGATGAVRTANVRLVDGKIVTTGE